MVSKARKVAKENGATFRGDTTSGSFSGKGVEGKYKVEDSTVRITITDKPTLASWSTVESRVKEFFRLLFLIRYVLQQGGTQQESLVSKMDEAIGYSYEEPTGG